MKKSKLIILALVTAFSLTACKDQGILNQNSTPENQSSLPQESIQPSAGSPTFKPSVPVMEFRINPDVISDLGLSYEQMVEKRGKLRSNTYKGVLFENGIGHYGWKSEGKSFWIDNDHTNPGGLPDAGGCNWIDGLNPQELFEGLTYPVNMNIFSKKYGFVPVSIGKEKEMDLYWSTFTHPMYEDVEFIFWTNEYGTIDEDSGCILSLDMDSLDAKPII